MNIVYIVPYNWKNSKICVYMLHILKEDNSQKSLFLKDKT